MIKKKRESKKPSFLPILLIIVVIISILSITAILLPERRADYKIIDLNRFEDWEQIESYQYTKLTTKDDHLLLMDNNQMLRAFAKNKFEDVKIGELVVNLKVLDNKDGYFYLTLKDSEGNGVFQIFRNNYGDYYFLRGMNLFLFDEGGNWNKFNISFNCNSGRYDFSLNNNLRLNSYEFYASEISSIELRTHKQTFQSKTEIDFEIFKVFK